MVFSKTDSGIGPLKLSRSELSRSIRANSSAYTLPIDAPRTWSRACSMLPLSMLLRMVGKRSRPRPSGKYFMYDEAIGPSVSGLVKMPCRILSVPGAACSRAKSSSDCFVCAAASGGMSENRAESLPA